MKTSSYLVSSAARSFISTEARVLLCLLDAPQATWPPPQGQNQSCPGFSHLPFILSSSPQKTAFLGFSLPPLANTSDDCQIGRSLKRIDSGEFAVTLQLVSEQSGSDQTGFYRITKWLLWFSHNISSVLFSPVSLLHYFMRTSSSSRWLSSVFLLKSASGAAAAAVSCLVFTGAVSLRWWRGGGVHVHVLHSCGRSGT